jgi:hypothetical protein
VILTVWVARTLFKNGRVFLVDAFSGKEALADSVNALLVVGFYLINIGYVTLALKYGDKPVEMVGTIESLSTKIGLVLLVLGFMHFFNLYVFAQARNRRLGAKHGVARPAPSPSNDGAKPNAELLLNVQANVPASDL